MSTICRICLGGGGIVTLSPLEDVRLTNIYEILTDSQFDSEDERPRVVCCFCYQSLLKCWTLSEMARRSETILTDLLFKGLKATYETVEGLDLGTKQRLSLSPMRFIDSEAVTFNDTSIFIIKVETVKLELTESDQSETDSANRYRNDECIKTDVICKEDSNEDDNIYECSIEVDNESTSLASGHDILGSDTSQSQKQEGVVKSDDKKSFQNVSVPFNQLTSKTHHCKMCDEKFNREIYLKRHMRIHEPYYACDKCDMIFITNQYLILHKKLHNKDTIKHKCQICDEKFIMKSIWKAHMKEHTKQQPYICDICDKKLISRPGIISHLKIHTGELALLRRQNSSKKKKLFNCPTCNKGFTRKFYLSRHNIKSHTGEDVEKKYGCDLCGRKFRQKPTLVNHNKICHYGEKAGACHVCGKQYNQISSLKRHLLSHSKEKPIFICKTCNKRYSRKSTLLQHMKFHTGDEKFYNCSVCEKQFNRKSNLEIHKRIHTGEKPYICSICLKQFRQKTAVEDHIMRVHTHEKTFICNICDKKFYTKSDLDRHSSKHTGVCKYACEECGKGFNLLCHLKKHRTQQHSDEKPYACNTCDQKFKYKNTLENHISSHTGEKKYACLICAKRFNTQPVLKRHMKQVHGTQVEQNIGAIGCSQTGVSECSES